MHGSRGLEPGEGLWERAADPHDLVGRGIPANDRHISGGNAELLREKAAELSIRLACLGGCCDADLETIAVEANDPRATRAGRDTDAELDTAIDHTREHSTGSIARPSRS